MKKLLLNSTFLFLILACSFFTPVPTPGDADIEKEEQVIYSFFVGGDGGTALILQETSTNISQTDSKDIRDNIMFGFKNVSKETVNSYLTRNAQPSQLSPNMDLGVEYVLLTPEDLSKITSQPKMGNGSSWNRSWCGYHSPSRAGKQKSLLYAVKCATRRRAME